MRNVDMLLRTAFLGSGVFALGCSDSGVISHAKEEEAIAQTHQALIVDRGDLAFTLEQIKIAEAHAAGQPLLPLIGHPQLPFGLRTVDGKFNNILPGQEFFGAADRLFPRLTTPVFRSAEGATFDPDGPGPLGVGSPTSYAQTSGLVFDAHPREISNLIVDLSDHNPAAIAAAAQTSGSVANVDGQGTFFIPNVAPDVGLSAPYNSWFTLFGQFFDHGLDLVSKGGSGTVIVPLAADDPLANTTSPINFMLLDRATNQPGPDGILGTADDVHEHINRTTPFVDQNQTYTSHPSHQVFLREYVFNGNGWPVSTGRLIDGARGGIGNWAEVKAQATNLLGIGLTDADIFDVPRLVTDPYGKFVPGANGFPQVVTASGSMEGNPAAPLNLTAIGAQRINHAFLDDIAHQAVPTPGLVADADSMLNAPPQPPGTYDDELLAAHFVTGDGRGNENIGLTAVHTIFHAEHNRLVQHVKGQILATANPTFIAEWLLPGANQADGIQDLEWNGERLFQAARFGTEMQYQHLVFEEFARKVQPEVNLFAGYDTSIDAAIMSEFAHVVYRFGHSLLTETIARKDADGTDHDLGLIEAFLNPPAFSAVGATDLEATGAIVRGMSRQVGNEVDEFVTNAVRNNLLGVPLDLATINMTRGRDIGVPPLNAARAMFFADTGDSALQPYTSWRDYELALRHHETLVNFVAAYGTHASITTAVTLADKRAAADALCNGGADEDFMNGTGAWANVDTGLDQVDFWVGGLAEKQMIFGGLLGPTFNFVFETQLERLQDGDRLYYLHRTAGLHFLAQLEENSFAELIMRNTNVRHLPLDVFSRPAFVFELANVGTSGPILDDPATPADEQNEAVLLRRMPDGTIRYTGVEHIVMGGTPGNDKMRASEGDDTLWGDEGDDRLEGGDGNDAINGGDGDDIITDLFGIDNIKGGAGNDVISAGPGLGDLILGGEGNDFVVAGSDPKETFGGQGDDFIFAGDSTDTVFGGEGDDWIEGGDQADLLQGDNGQPFQDSPVIGHDVLFGQGGDDDYDCESGDDIMVSDFGTERHEGMLGFDWVTYKGAPQPVDADMAVSVLLPPSVENFRDRFDLVEGLSGWDHNDILRGDDETTAELTAIDANSGQNNALNDSGQIARILGLEDVLGLGATSFSGGNIILGGAGSDLIEGRGGDDIIDGDRWLDVRLSVRDATNTEIAIADGMRTPLRNKSGILAGTPATFTLQEAMFAGTLNPGQLVIIREISTAAANPLDIDTAIFSGPIADYDLVNNVDGSTTVIHARGTLLDGTDRLLNIETLQFSDIAVSVGVAGNQPLGLAPVVFTDQEVATTSAIRSATLINSGNTPLNVTNVVVQGANAADFPMIANNCTGTTLTTGAFCTVTLTFRPTAVGARTAQLNLSVVSNGNPATLNAAVSGTGTSNIAMVTPTNLAFGNQRLRQMSPGKTVTFKNTSGAPFWMGNVSRQGPDRNDFATISNNCNGQLANGATCSIVVICRPRAIGLRSAELRIAYTGPSSPRVIPMTCNGIP